MVAYHPSMASTSSPSIDENNSDDIEQVKRLSSAYETSDRALSMPKTKRGTYIARLIICLEECLKSLGVSTKTHPTLLSSLEGISCFIHESMSIGSRNYHSVQHVFDVAQGLDDEDPISVIAALFHDCVYYHVDGGLSDLQYDKLRGVVAYQAGPISCSHLTTTATDNHHIPVYQAKTPDKPSLDTRKDNEAVLLGIVEKVFGYTQGQHVNHQNGLNEFLSAVICVRELEPFLSKAILAQLACCIEATIPFRAPNNNNNNNKDGKTCMEQLFDRMVYVNKCFDLGLSRAELIQSVQRAAHISNSDLANFGTQDVFWFLDNTWSLLPESNEGLRRQYLSSVKQFQFAVFKMYGFFNFLKAEHVFVEFQGQPPPHKLQQRVTNAERNLALGRKYVGAKLLSLSVLAAFAELTGGDAPISLFMGDLPSRASQGAASMTTTSGQAGNNGMRNSKILSFSERIVEESQFLAYPDNDTATNIDSDVYEVLSKGRRSETNFDVKQSPMAAYLYSILGDEEFLSILKEIPLHPMTSTAAWTLLRRLPRYAVVEIANHIQFVAISRTEKIVDLVDQL
ncbi:hypothetical protein ACA910_008124 [Epithemia clementina (nom. ined.)]